MRQREAEDTLRVDRIGPRISEFEFVVLSADSIVIAYLRGACTPETAASTYFMLRPSEHARVHPHVFARHPTSGTFIVGRHVVYTLALRALFPARRRVPVAPCLAVDYGDRYLLRRYVKRSVL